MTGVLRRAAALALVTLGCAMLLAAPAGATEVTQQPRTVPWWPFALLLGIAALIGVTLFRRR